MDATHRKYSPGLFYSGLLIGVAGLAFYLLSASTIGSVANWPLTTFFGSSTFKHTFIGSFPSFSHSLASSLLLASLCVISLRTRVVSILIVLSLLLTFERTMGTYDIMDAYALMLGAALSCLTLFVHPKRNITIRSVGAVPAVIISISAALAVGSYTPQPGCARYEGTECVESKSFANPIYMSFNDLRSAIELEGPHDLTAIGRLYLYKNLIFMNEINEGIHIIDNRFPANPEPIGFIRIPGNLDINIKGDYLYADSYVDLVTLNLTDINNIYEVSRDIDIFPFNPFQNIPNEIDFEYGVVDSSKGVIIGYE